jgi:flagellar basal body-associated protein FliL
MLKLVAIGIWVILVTAGATAASTFFGRASGAGTPAAEDRGVEQISSDLMSVPVIRGGDVTGYVILQLSFAADRAMLERKKTEPLPFMKDAAFRIIFTSTDVDFRRLRPGDLDRLTKAIAQEANARLGEDLVREVLLQQVNYVRKEDIRTNWISGGSGAN